MNYKLKPTLLAMLVTISFQGCYATTTNSIETSTEKSNGVITNMPIKENLEFNPSPLASFKSKGKPKSKAS